MRRRIRRYVLFSMLCFFTIALTACNKNAEAGNQGTSAPTVTSAPTPTTFPLTTLPPTPTPLPARTVALAQLDYDECSVIDCDDYYFEVLSFKAQDAGGYAIETVFENRLDFAVTIVISDLHVNFLKPTWFDLKYYDWAEFVYSYDREEKVIEPGEKKTIELWISDAYAKRLNISDVTDLNCVQFYYTVEAADETVFDYYDINRIMYYRYGRELVKPYEHDLENDDIVLVDREDVKLYLTDFIYDEDGDCYVYFYWENNTTELLKYKFYQQSINGYERWKVLNYFEEVILYPGMGSYDFFILSASEINKSGATSVSELEMDLYMSCNTGLWRWETIVEETFNLYPLERRAVQKEKIDSYCENILLLDTDYYRMVYNGFHWEVRENEAGRYTYYVLHLFLENKSAQMLRFVVKDATFNGESLTNSLNYRNISSGKEEDIVLRWEDQGMKFEGFPELDSLELTVQIKNMDDEKQSVVFEEMITVLP